MKCPFNLTTGCGDTDYDVESLSVHFMTHDHNKTADMIPRSKIQARIKQLEAVKEGAFHGCWDKSDLIAELRALLNDTEKVEK